MQLLLVGKSSGMISLTTTAVYVPITTPVMALGSKELGALIQVPPGQPATVSAQLAYRFFSTDDSQSATAWVDVSTSQVGPGKSFKSGSVSTVDGMFIQFGLKLSTTSGTATARASLQRPILVTV